MRWWSTQKTTGKGIWKCIQAHRHTQMQISITPKLCTWHSLLSHLCVFDYKKMNVTVCQEHTHTHTHSKQICVRVGSKDPSATMTSRIKPCFVSKQADRGLANLIFRDRRQTGLPGDDDNRFRSGSGKVRISQSDKLNAGTLCMQNTQDYLARSQS